MHGDSNQKGEAFHAVAALPADGVAGVVDEVCRFVLLRSCEGQFGSCLGSRTSQCLQAAAAVCGFVFAHGLAFFSFSEVGKRVDET